MLGLLNIMWVLANYEVAFINSKIEIKINPEYTKSCVQSQKNSNNNIMS